MNKEVITAEDPKKSSATSVTTEKEIPKEINSRTVRFSDAPWYKAGLQVLIGGAGGIGSWLAFFLGRQDTELYIFDFDVIDETNMGGQHFTTSDIGKNKAECVAKQIEEFSDNKNVTALGKYEEDSFTHNMVFAAFDNMAARELMFNKWLEYVNSEEMKDKPALFIDGRLLAEDLQIYAVTRETADKYTEYLWKDSEVDDVPCSFKATSHCSALIGSLMTGIYNNYLTNIHYGFEAREVPFRTSLELATLMFNTKEDGTIQSDTK